MSYALRNQPLKGLYLIYQLISTVLVRIPLWILLSIPRSWRPRNSWNIQRALMVKIIRHLTYVTGRTGPIVIVPNHLAITLGAGVNGIWIEPVPQLVTGQLLTWMEANSVSPARIPGYWTHKKGSQIEIGAAPTPGEKVLYHLHGGAYVRLSAHPKDVTAVIARGILQHVDSVHRSFAVEYRLSSSKPYEVANPFPAALLDALAGYNYLVNTVGFSPSDILLVGDSAGANLAHALTRYLVEYKDTPDIAIPASPGALVLLSPWCDFGVSHEQPGTSSENFIVSDYIHPTRGGINYAKDSFLGALGASEAPHNTYISPSSLDPAMTIDFHGFPRTFIAAGGAEVLFDQIVTLKDRMIKDLGDDKVYYHEAKDGIHDYMVFEWHEPERTQTLKALAKWFEN